MRVWCRFLILAACGCASAPPAISPQIRRAASAVQLIEGGPPAGFRLIGEIEGYSCSALRSTQPTVGIARDSLKLEAARRGATVVVSIICQPGDLPFSDNCWKSIRCVGDAGRLP